MRFLLTIILFTIYTTGCTQKAERQKTGDNADIDTATVVTEGKRITQAAFKTLSSNLKKALSDGGVAYAVDFCNVEAMRLTDSLSTNYGVELERASHRPRNPVNRADSLEMESITRYLIQLKKEKELEPLVYITEQKIIYHSPIRIASGLCLSCHGKPGTDIANGDLKTIERLYPQDQATGFEMGELRGLWTIRFPKNHFK